MSPAGWGLLGTVFGAALTTAGNLLQRWLDASTRNKAERDEQAKRTRDERKVAYLRLLTAARGLRFLSQGSGADDADVDALRSELSSVNYEIELIGSPAVITRAEEVRRKTLDYVDVVTDRRGDGGRKRTDGPPARGGRRGEAGGGRLHQGRAVGPGCGRRIMIDEPEAGFRPRARLHVDPVR